MTDRSERASLSLYAPLSASVNAPATRATWLDNELRMAGSS